jgi:hypothetical protein
MNASASFYEQHAHGPTIFRAVTLYFDLLQPLSTSGVSRSLLAGASLQSDEADACLHHNSSARHARNNINTATPLSFAITRALFRALATARFIACRIISPI